MGRINNYFPVGKMITPFFLLLFVLLLYVPWGAVLHTGISIPAHLGWSLFGVLFIGMSCFKVQTCYFSRLFALGGVFLLLPILWLPEQTDVWSLLPRLIGLVIGGVFIVYIGGLTMAQGQLSRVNGALVLFGSICALSVLLRKFCPKLYSEWLPLAGGGWAPGGLLQPDLMATLLAVALLLAVNHWIFNRRKISLLLVSLFSFSLVLCQSAIGLFGAIIGLLVILALSARSYHRRISLATFFILLFGLCAAILLHFLFKQPIFHPYDFKAAYWIYQSCLALFMQDPVLGVGYGNFEAMFPTGVALAGLKSLYHSTAVVSHPNNEVFYWLVEGGVLALCGILLLAMWGGRVFIKAFLLAIRSGGYGSSDSVGLGWLLSSIPLILHILFGSPWYASPVHYFIFLLLVSMAITCMHKSDKSNIKSLSSTVPTRIITILLGCGLLWYSVTGTFVAVGVQEVRQSQGRDINTLHAAELYNPWYMSDSVEFAKAVNLLNQFDVTSDTAKLSQAIVMLKDYLMRHPDPNVYSVLITALDMQGSTTEAESLYFQAQGKLPWDDRFTPGIEARF